MAHFQELARVLLSAGGALDPNDKGTHFLYTTNGILTSKHLIEERGNAHEAQAEREGLPGRLKKGEGFFEKARADSETWDLGFATNEGKLEELSEPAAYVVVGFAQPALTPASEARVPLLLLCA